jgi:transcriptional regulator with XRE-family HTH domain
MYALSITDGITMEISQDELRSLLGEIETQLHQSKVYRHALATIQKLLGSSSEQASGLFKAVGREAISLVFQQLLQKHQEVGENNQQKDDNSQTSDSTDLHQCLTIVQSTEKPTPTTTNKAELLAEPNEVKNTAVQKNSPSARKPMKWLSTFNKKQSPVEQTLPTPGKKRSEALRQIGEELRRTREFHNISLQDLNAYTHIQIPYLEAVENGNWELLPEEVFVRGYIRAMGNALGLNGTALATSLPEPEPIKTVLPPSYKSNKSFASGLGLRPIHLYLGYTTLMAGAIGGLSMLNHHLEASAPSSSPFTQSLQDQKPTTKPKTQSNPKGVVVGSDISPPESL